MEGTRIPVLGGLGGLRSRGEELGACKRHIGSFSYRLLQFSGKFLWKRQEVLLGEWVRSRFMDPCAQFFVCVWVRSFCLSALLSYHAPDEAIRAVTGVARLHCLYLAGVSVVCCQIVVLISCLALCQSF